MLCGMVPLKYGFQLMSNTTKLVRLAIPAGMLPHRPFWKRMNFSRWGKAEKSNLSSVPFKLVLRLSSVISPAELQVICVHLQRLVELAIDHDPRDSSAPSKLAFQFTSASASRRMSALTGTVAHSRRHDGDAS
ncbi:hypothetical protein ZWY2020_027677 [Hordeum vulgare]|nr:hypothetical protein ZWY2020_027677 [Hordeum vulgare]